MLKAARAGGLADKAYAIQGFGNVGAWAAELFEEEKGRVVAVSDAFGATHNDAGLDVKALRAHVAAGGKLADFAGGAAIDKSDILKVDCDVLVPAAIGGVIDENTAGDVRAKYVVEAANGPTTPEGDRVLRERGVTVLPDIYTNGGGVTVSFFEWVQNLQNFRWDESAVNERLDKTMTAAFEDVWRVASEKGLPLRTAAFVVALQRVTRAHLHRGFD